MELSRIVELLLSWPPLAFIAFIISVFVFTQSDIIKKFRFKGLEVEFKETSEKLEKQEEELSAQRELIEAQQERINNLVRYSMSDEIYGYLIAISHGKHFLFHKDPGFRSRLEYLIFNNYIYALDRLDDYIEGENIVSDARPTMKGFEYIKLRENA